jgi:tRNA-uridine 2-sulfurtransferase
VRVLAALSGGVDSSVAAALLLAEGHDVVAVTMKLWGGAQDSGCCSVGDVEDARRVAQQLGIPHHVFNFTDEFDQHVVGPYTDAHAAGRTPNPCIDCNRHVKFDRLLRRADQLGFDAVATGHYARVTPDHRLLRGADVSKDQSYVLYALTPKQLRRVRFPIGHLTKGDVRRQAETLGLRTAGKVESQDTCFVTASGGRLQFLGDRISLHAGRVVDGTGAEVGRVPAVELITVGQRRGLGGGARERRYAVAVDVPARTVTIGTLDDLRTDRVELEGLTWTTGAAPPPGAAVSVQASAHGPALGARWDGAAVRYDRPARRPAPGQALVVYGGDEVLGGGTVRSSPPARA